MKKITNLLLTLTLLFSVTLSANATVVHLATLAEINSATPETYIVDADLVVMYVNGDDVYVADATAAVKFVESNTVLKSGDTLRNTQFTIIQNLFGKKMQCDSYTRVVGTVDYVVPERTSILDTDEYRYIALKNVEITNQGGGLFYMNFDGKTYEIFDDYMDVSALEDAHYNVEGIYFKNLTRLKFNMLSFVKVTTMPSAIETVNQTNVSYQDGIIVNPQGHTVSIFTALGTKVLQSSLDIDMRELPRGVYIVVSQNGSFKVNN